MKLDTFYQSLPVLSAFEEVCELKNYRKIPDDWYVIVADVVNSTKSIKSGKYKAVNFVGVSVIVAILNISKEELPYIFGGDGASMCIPPYLHKKSRQVLAATRDICIQKFDLTLRIGIIPVNLLLQDGHELLVAKHKVSKYCTHAAFTGGGMERADILLKNNDKRIENLSNANVEFDTSNYDGLECRWDSIPSKHGETISLIIKSTHSELKEQNNFYSDVLAVIKRVYGEDSICRPVTESGLSFAFNSEKLGLETDLKTFNKNKIKRHLFLNIIRLQNLLGLIFMRFKLNISGTSWGKYKPDLVQNTDFKKFDGTLRLVISGNTAQRNELEKYLKSKNKQKSCVYGMHVSDSAYITCLINNRAGDHFHFVDGADGGYAAASIQFKKQLNEMF